MPQRPWAPAASPSSSDWTPASTRALRASAPSMPRIAPVLIRIASSSEASGAAPWPVLWPLTRSPFSAAKATVAAMSSALSTKATALGRRSAARFQAARASSQSASLGVATRPSIESPVKSVTAVLLVWGQRHTVHGALPPHEAPR